MLSLLTFSSLLVTSLAARDFINEPDTGFDAFLPSIGELAPIDSIKGLTDFDAAARTYMNASSYAYYRNGAAGEWSYRNNLESFGRVRLRPRTFVDITNVENTIPTTILGHNYSVPFFIAPCARAGLANVSAEISLMKGAEAANMLYATSYFSSIPLEQVVAAKEGGATGPYPSWQQLYVDNNDSTVEAAFRRIEALGQKAIFLTVDSAADGVRQRAVRYGQGSADTSLTLFTWERYKKLQALTSIPLIPKGIQTVEDVKLAIENGAPAIYLSNHGGRQVDFSPSAFEIALEVYEEDPNLFKQIEIYADGGVRYGTDIIKLLALGVKAVGVGRPFMYANVYGEEGVAKAFKLLRNELLNDAGNLGVADLKNVSPTVLNLKTAYNNGWYTK